MKVNVLVVNEAVNAFHWHWRQFGFIPTVLASVPLCDITEEDLTRNPQFCKLLATLSQHVDQTGLSAPLKTELDKVPTDTTPNGTTSCCFVTTIQARFNLGQCATIFLGFAQKRTQRTFLFLPIDCVRFCVVNRQSRSCKATGVSGCALRASTSVCRRCYKITASESTMGLCPLTKTTYVPPYQFATICAI